MSKNYYVVVTGKKPGIYGSYEKAKANTKGYKNSKLKGFNNLQKAETYFQNNTKLVTLPKKTKASTNRVTSAEDLKRHYVVFVDKNDVTGCIIKNSEKALKLTLGKSGSLIKRYSNKAQACKYLSILADKRKQDLSQGNVLHSTIRLQQMQPNYMVPQYTASVNDATDIKQELKNSAKLVKGAELTIYTDGGEVKRKACHISSWAYLIKSNTGLMLDDGGVAIDVNNHAMEVRAVTQALRKILALGMQFKSVTVVTDSEFIISHWNSRNTSTDIKSEYTDLLVLYQLQQYFTNLKVSWCKGHSKIAGNEYVDTRCTELMNTVNPAGLKSAQYTVAEIISDNSHLSEYQPVPYNATKSKSEENNSSNLDTVQNHSAFLKLVTKIFN